MASIYDISTKMFGLAFLLYAHNIHCDAKFTSLQTQLDQIQRKLEENDDKLFHDKKGEMLRDRGRKSLIKGGVLKLKSKGKKRPAFNILHYIIIFQGLCCVSKLSLIMYLCFVT